MSMKKLIFNATKVAINAFGDLNESSPYSRQGDFTINAFTEGLSAPAVSTNVKILAYGFKETEIDGSRILKTDLKSIVHVSNLPTGAVISNNDFATIKGVRYEVFDFKLDPSGSVYFLHLRAV